MMCLYLQGFVLIILTCLPEGLAITCDFESDFCGWIQDPNDQFNWQRSQGPTPARQYGRNNWGIDDDHTLQSGSGWFIHADLNAPSEGDKARIQTTELSSSNRMVFSFWFHMYVRQSSASGFALNVFLSNENGDEVVLWQQDAVTTEDEWTYAEVDLPPCTSNCTIVFEAIKGDSRYMEIGLDDIIIEEAIATTPPTFAPAECTFEYDFCDFHQDDKDDFDWLLNTGTTPSGATGPSNDHTYGNVGNGTYVYIEASSPRLEGDKARLVSMIYPVHDNGDYTTVSFYNHMHGTSMGTMNAYIYNTDSNTEELIWSKSGQQGRTYGDHWLYTEVHVNVTYPFQVVIEAVVGSSYLGDMAIDDISITRVITQQPTTSYQTSSELVTSTAVTPSRSTVTESIISVTLNVGTERRDETQKITTEKESTTSTRVVAPGRTRPLTSMTITQDLVTSETFSGKSTGSKIWKTLAAGSTLAAGVTSKAMTSSTSMTEPLASSLFNTRTSKTEETEGTTTMSDHSTVVGTEKSVTGTQRQETPISNSPSQKLEDVVTLTSEVIKTPQNITKHRDKVSKANDHSDLILITCCIVGGVMALCISAALSILVYRQYVKNKIFPEVKCCLQTDHTVNQPVCDTHDKNKLVDSDKVLHNLKKSRHRLKWADNEMTIITVI
ncbi:uncharacterized protein LOC144444715 [Glandiceps talaboti]